MQSIGKILIITGAIAILAGVVICFAGNKLSWLGHLPGDIRIENENVKFYFPVTTMVGGYHSRTCIRLRVGML